MNRLPGDASLRTKLTLSALFSPQFFVAQAVGITIEDAFIAVAERVFGGTGKKGEKKSIMLSPPVSTAGRMLGYAWVFAWFCATYPQFTRNVLIWVY